MATLENVAETVIKTNYQYQDSLENLSKPRNVSEN